jgi:hypothetical protein
MLTYSEARQVRVVVKTDEVLAPKNEHRMFVSENDSEHDLQSFRPKFCWSELMARPINRTRESPSLTIIKKVERVFYQSETSQMLQGSFSSKLIG